MTTITHAEASRALGLSPERLEFPEEFVPVASGITRQGDVLPRRVASLPSGVEAAPVGREGVTIVQGDNAHILHALDEAASVRFAPVRDDRYVVGYAAVDGGNALLTHTEEHGSMELTPGVWQFRCPEELTISGYVRVLD